MLLFFLKNLYDGVSGGRYPLVKTAENLSPPFLQGFSPFNEKYYHFPLYHEAFLSTRIFSSPIIHSGLHTTGILLNAKEKRSSVRDSSVTAVGNVAGKRVNLESREHTYSRILHKVFLSLQDSRSVIPLQENPLWKAKTFGLQRKGNTRFFFSP